MIPAKRQQKIVEILKREGITAINELAEQLNVSHMTIRRDIDSLSDRKIVACSYGGVSLYQELKREQLYKLRMNKNIEGKTKIAKAAAELIKPGYTLPAGCGYYNISVSNTHKRYRQPYGYYAGFKHCS